MLVSLSFFNNFDFLGLRQVFRSGELVSGKDLTDKIFININVTHNKLLYVYVFNLSE
jgi:hypothetical protein